MVSADLIKVKLLKYYIQVGLFIFLSGFSCLPAAAGHVTPEKAETAPIVNLIDNGGFAVEKNNTYLTAHNLDTLFIPASIIKIATCLTALDILGSRFRFTTAFFRDNHNNLYIKGYGDPFLVSEEILIIVRKLKELGWTEINDIYLDNTTFNLKGPAEGSGTSDNPYDADNSGLAVNFNTINIEIRADGGVVSAEPQTPTLPLMAELAKGMEPGVYRLNISRDNKNGKDITSRYVGELFRAFQNQEHIGGAGKIAVRKTPAGIEPGYIHSSGRTLEDIIPLLLLYSNNFIANQIFLVLGTHKFGYPATWEKSITVVSDFLRDKFHLTPDEIIIKEGSGLSRKNRVSPRAMIKLLDAFKPYAELLPLKDGKYIKSGTLTGVYSYAGYFVENKRLDGFVLLLNQKTNRRNQILEMLEKVYRQK